MENKTVTGYYFVDFAYTGNSKITLLNKDGWFSSYTIVNDYNVEGYCKCLRDFGYQNYDNVVFNGDVVCIEGNTKLENMTSKGGFETGKRYKCTHGNVTDEYDCLMKSGVKSFDELNSYSSAKFIEIKE